MAIRKLNPTTSGSRGVSFDDFSGLTKKRPEKSLTVGFKRGVGRDADGRISVRHKGGGVKRLYRVINFGQLEGQWNITAIEYDPNRSAFIALIKNTEGKKQYILASSNMKTGDVITDGKAIGEGRRLKMRDIPTGVAIHNIEMQPGSRGKLVRSAGTSATIIAKDGDYALIKLPSSETRKIHLECQASIGTVSNATHNTIRIGKAGRSRLMGKRPSVRGKAMNPNSHPHGGGEAQNSIGLKYPKTPWGKHALGKKTRKLHKFSDSMIVKRRKVR